MKNIFRPIQTYTVLTQDTSTIFINQLLTSHAFRKEHIMLGSKFSVICHLISKVLWMKKHELSSTKTIIKYTLSLCCWWILIVKKITHTFKGCVNSIDWWYWCIHVEEILNSLMCNHCVFLGFIMWKLKLCCTYIFASIWHIPHPTVILTNSGSRECNVM
jgi:hypothetical protein